MSIRVIRSANKVLDGTAALSLLIVKLYTYTNPATLANMDNIACIEP
jgi:hypothetical protein